MTIRRMDNAGSVVDDLAPTTAFVVELGLELHGEGWSRAGGWTASWGSMRRSRSWRLRTARAANGGASAGAQLEIWY